MTQAKAELESKAKAAKAASRRMAYLSAEIKNKALHNISADILAKQKEILAANQIDYHEAHSSGMNAAMLDRLMLSPERLEAIASDVLAVAALPDPVGEVFEMRTLPNGLQLGKRRVPLGVIGAIYESRPNVTIDISVLCLKSGNAIILRGGREAVHSNSALAKVVQDAANRAGVPEGAVQFIENTDRKLVDEMLQMRQYIDLIIPRGGAGLIKLVRDNAAMPVVAGGIGVCHTYVDKSADIGKAVAIVYNLAAAELAKAGVEMHCDKRAMAILKSNSSLKLKAATEEDWGKEFLALVAAIKVVDSLDEALEHIARYGSGHSEAILTEEYGAAMRFLNEVDASAVYANASTRFTDGSMFGLGAEVGISTQKFHARGPLGVRELTSYKWIIFGSGQIRP